LIIALCKHLLSKFIIIIIGVHPQVIRTQGGGCVEVGFG
jgi:hypothetical protein